MSKEIRKLEDFSKTELTNEIINLRNKASAQKSRIKELSALLEDKINQIASLENQLEAYLTEPPETNDCDSIADYQLERLLLKAKEQELTLEEARKIEIYSKIKNQSKKPSDIYPSYRNLTASKDPDKLLEMATKQIKATGE